MDGWTDRWTDKQTEKADVNGTDRNQAAARTHPGPRDLTLARAASSSSSIMRCTLLLWKRWSQATPMSHIHDESAPAVHMATVAPNCVSTARSTKFA